MAEFSKCSCCRRSADEVRLYRCMMPHKQPDGSMAPCGQPICFMCSRRCTEHELTEQQIADIYFGGMNPRKCNPQLRTCGFPVLNVWTWTTEFYDDPENKLARRWLVDKRTA